MSTLSAALRGINRGREKNERQEQLDREAKQREQLFKLTLDKSKREQKAFDAQQTFRDLFANAFQAAMGIEEPTVLTGDQGTDPDTGLPRLKQADGKPTVAPSRATVSEDKFREFLSDPANLFLAKQAGFDLTQIASLEERRTSGQERRVLTKRGQDKPRLVEMTDAQGNIHNVLTDPRTGEVIQSLGLKEQAPLSPVDVTSGGRTTRQFINPRTVFKGQAGIQLTDKKGLPAEGAAKLKLAETGLQDIIEFEKILIQEDGSINRKLLTQMKGNIPFTQGREANSLVLNAIEAKLRAESGAAVPEEEVTRMMKKFVPDILDNDKTIKSKVRRLKLFLGGTVEIIDPNKTYTRNDVRFKDSTGRNLVIIAPGGSKPSTAEEYLRKNR
jgi:hypothetical protein